MWYGQRRLVPVAAIALLATSAVPALGEDDYSVPACRTYVATDDSLTNNDCFQRCMKVKDLLKLGDSFEELSTAEVKGHAELKNCQYSHWSWLNGRTQPEGDCFDSWVYGYSQPASIDKSMKGLSSYKEIMVATPAECQAQCQADKDCYNWALYVPLSSPPDADNLELPCMLKNIEQVMKAADQLTTEGSTIDTQYCNYGMPYSCEHTYDCMGCKGEKRCIYHSNIHLSGWRNCAKYDRCLAKPIDTTTPIPTTSDLADKSTAIQTDTAETKPAETKPAETKPVETKPVETKPVETTPAQTKSVETKPVETSSVETKPVETTPAETKPVETTPAQTKPVETKPVETTPAQTESADTTAVQTTSVETTSAETEPVETRAAVVTTAVVSETSKDSRWLPTSSEAVPTSRKSLCDRYMSMKKDVTHMECMRECENVVTRGVPSKMSQSEYELNCKSQHFIWRHNSVIPDGSCMSNMIYGYSDIEKVHQAAFRTIPLSTPALCAASCQQHYKCVNWVYNVLTGLCGLKSYDMVQDAVYTHISTEDTVVDGNVCPPNLPSRCFSDEAKCLDCCHELKICAYEHPLMLSGWKYCGIEMNHCDPDLCLLKPIVDSKTAQLNIGAGSSGCSHCGHHEASQQEEI